MRAVAALIGRERDPQVGDGVGLGRGSRVNRNHVHEWGIRVK
jgi:hypothetical protein